MPLDRRLYDRVRAPRILVRVPSLDKLRSHYLRDLSAGGLFVRSEKMLPVGTEVDIELVPPGLDRPLTLHARVARLVEDEAARLAGTAGMGVRFENLSPEAERALAALIAECMEGSQPPITELRGQVQTLVLELSAVRQTLAEREAELAATKAPLGSPQAIDGQEVLLQLRRDNDNLRQDLEEAQSKFRTLQADYAALEQDEVTTRALAERLANERTALERAEEENLNRLRGELERLTELNRSAVDQLIQMRAAQSEAETQRDRASRFERQLAEVNKELERSKERERDLRRLLSALNADISQRSAPSPIATSEQTDAANIVQEPEIKAGEVSQDNTEVRLNRDASPQPTNLESSNNWAVDPIGLSGAVLDMAEPRWTQTSNVSSLTELTESDFLAPAAAESSSPPEVENQSSLSAQVSLPPLETQEEDFNIDVSEPPAEIPIAPAEERIQIENNLKVADFSKELPGQVSDFTDFHRRLLGGAKIRLTDRFYLYTPIDPYEILISGLLERTDNINGLRDLASGRANDDRLVQVVFGFYVRSLVNLSDGAAPAEVLSSGGAA